MNKLSKLFLIAVVSVLAFGCQHEEQAAVQPNTAPEGNFGIKALVASINKDDQVYKLLLALAEESDNEKGVEIFGALHAYMFNTYPAYAKLTDEDAQVLFSTSILSQFGRLRIEKQGIAPVGIDGKPAGAGERNFLPSCFSGIHFCCTLITGGLAPRCFDFYCPGVPDDVICFRA